MTPSLATASTSSIWRRVGASLALAGALAFALQPNLLLAQAVQADDPPAKAQAEAAEAQTGGKESIAHFAHGQRLGRS